MTSPKSELSPIVIMGDETDQQTTRGGGGTLVEEMGMKYPLLPISIGSIELSAWRSSSRE